MTLNIHVFYRPKNSATATECQLTYNEDWQTKADNSDVGDLVCSNGTSNDLIKSGDHVNIQGTSEPVSDNTDVYFAIDASDPTLIKKNSEQEIIDYFESKREPEVTTKITIKNAEYPFVRLGLGFGYHNAKETTSLPAGLYDEPAEQEGSPFGGVQGSLEATFFPSAFADDKWWKFFPSLLLGTSLYGRRVLSGNINDHYTAEKDSNGTYSISELSLNWAPELSVAGIRLLAEDKYPGWDLYLRYATPIVAKTWTSGRWAHSGGSLAVDVSESNISYFDINRLMLGANGVTPYGSFGGELSFMLPHDIEGSPSMQEWAVTMGFVWTFNASSEEEKAQVGDKAVTLSKLNAVVIPTPVAAVVPPLTPPAPPPPPKSLLDFRQVDVPTSAKSEANASTTFVTGKNNLVGSTADPTRNDGVQAIVTAMEDYVKSLEEIGLKDVTFDVDLLAGADFASGAAYNKKLSDARSKSFISGSTSKDKTQVNGLQKALADSSALRASGATIQNITPRGVGESMPVAYYLCSEDYIKNIRGQKAKNEALIRAVAETISNIKSNADFVPSEVIVKDKSPSGPFFAPDGATIRGSYETPAIKNGGYGIFKESGRYYLVNYQASRRVLAKMRATKVPAFEIAGASSPTMDDKTVGEFTFHNMPITNANGIEQTPNPLSDADLSNFVGAILKVAGTVQHGKKLVVQIALPKAKLDSMGDDAVNKIAKYLGVASTVKGKLPVEVIIAKDTDTATMEKDRVVLSVVDASTSIDDAKFKEALSEALLMK